MQVKWSLGRRIRTEIEIPKRHIHSLKPRINGEYFQGWVSVGVLRVCLCSSTEPSRTWTSGARASLTFRSSLHLQVRPAPAFTGVVAFLLRGGHSIRAQARSRSSVHRSIPSRMPKGPATQCLGLWSGPEEPAALSSKQSAACRMGLEGLVSKRRDRPYQAGRSKHWVKIKNRSHPAMSRVMESFG